VKAKRFLRRKKSSLVLVVEELEDPRDEVDRRRSKDPGDSSRAETDPAAAAAGERRLAGVAVELGVVAAEGTAAAEADAADRSAEVGQP